MKEYTYSVARVRAKESSLLTRQDIEQLIAAPDYGTALRIIRDKGYRGEDNESAEDIIKAAERELWAFLEEVADEDVMRIMRLPIDYHNIKASVKAVFSGIDGTDLLLDNGTADKKAIYESVKARSYDNLDAHIAETAEEAMALLLRTQDGQACAIYVDNEMLKAIEDTAQKSGDEFLKRYADITADTANLKAALRCAAAEKNLSFIENALYDGGTLDFTGLSRAAAAGIDAVHEYVETTAYADGIEYMKKSAAAFEKWCDDRLMSLMNEVKYESFSSAPLLAYYYAKRTELNTVRLILFAKQNMLDDNMIRERVREVYV